MLEVRILRRLGGVAILVSLLAQEGRSQCQWPDLYVHRRLGNNANNGRSWDPTLPFPDGPVQTITRALEYASATIATCGPYQRTIWIAGAEAPPPTMGIEYYEDVAGPPPGGIECFPLPMLPAVSLAWDVANSDLQVPPLGGPPEPIRPVIRSAPASGAPALLTFSSQAPTCIPGTGLPFCPGYFYAPGFPITISGLRFDRIAAANAAAVQIDDGPCAIVRPTFSEVKQGSFCKPLTG